MSRSKIVTHVFVIIFLFIICVKTVGAQDNYWRIQSIDAVKYSRDQARWRLTDPGFDQEINNQVEQIKNLGATHVAVGTPYDAEFIPYLKRWVRITREKGLKVWFRGNFSGWEGWFYYPRIDRDEHLGKTYSFIVDNPDLFEDGDIFTPCTECENGGPGDPRSNGDAEGHRDFLIKLYESSKSAFETINKKVDTGFFSMNYDVAWLIMDKETTEGVGGVVAIDHYVSTTDRTADDITKIAERSGGNVVLGEVGVPIPDIHGSMTQSQQAKWMEDLFHKVSNKPELLGVNYWTNKDSSTALFSYNDQAREVTNVLRTFYSPKVITGKVVNKLDQPVKDATISAGIKTYYSDNEGKFEILAPPSLTEFSVSANSYSSKNITLENKDNYEIMLEKDPEDFMFRFRVWLYYLFTKSDETISF